MLAIVYMIYAFFQRAIMVKGTNSSTFVSYGASWSFLERLSIAGLEYWGVRFILARIVSAYFSSRSVTVSFYSASFRLMLHLFIRQCFQRNVEVKSLGGKIGLDFGYLSLKHINNLFLFICHVSSAFFSFALAH